jgi:antitoxin PrlF
MPKVTSNGRITIPIKVRSALGVQPGDRVEFVERENGQFSVVAATRSVRDLKGMFKKRGGKPVSIGQMNAAIVKRGSR